MTEAVRDEDWLTEAREAAVQAMVAALAAELAPYRWLPAALLPSPWLARIATRQLEAVLALPGPTRAALLGARS